MLLLVNGRITVSATGAQSLSATLPGYDPITSTFRFPWRTGPVTVTITITYPNAPTQRVTIPITLS